MNNKITRSQFQKSIKIQQNVLFAQNNLQTLSNHLEFLTRTGDLVKLVEFANSLYDYSTSTISNFLDTLSDDEK